MQITIFGAGAYGHALGHILEENNHEIIFYDPAKFPENNLEKVLENPDAIILALPSTAIVDFLSIFPKEKYNLPIICATKGLLSIEPFASFSNFSVISGPTFAIDLENDKPSTLTSSSDLPIELFSRPWLKIEKADDPLGIALCGTLKNIYAIEAGFKNLKKEDPEFSNFINEVEKELKTILAANNCNPLTFNRACGIDDLVMTCSSLTSRNYQFGKLLSENSNAKPNQTTEGLNAIHSISNSQSFILPENTSLIHEIILKIKV